MGRCRSLWTIVIRSRCLHRPEDASVDSVPSVMIDLGQIRSALGLGLGGGAAITELQAPEPAVAPDELD